MNGIIQKVASGEIKLSSIQLGFPFYRWLSQDYNVISTDVSKDIEFYVALDSGTSPNAFYCLTQKWKYLGSSQSFVKIEEYEEGSIADTEYVSIESQNLVVNNYVLVGAYRNRTDNSFYFCPSVLIIS